MCLISCFAGCAIHEIEVYYIEIEHYKNFIYLGLLSPMMQGALDAGALIFWLHLMHLESRQNNTLVY